MGSHHRHKMLELIWVFIFILLKVWQKLWVVVWRSKRFLSIMIYPEKKKNERKTNFEFFWENWSGRLEVLKQLKVLKPLSVAKLDILKIIIILIWEKGYPWWYIGTGFQLCFIDKLKKMILAEVIKNSNNHALNVLHLNSKNRYT